MSAGSSRTFASGLGGASGRQRVIVCYNCKGKGHMSKQFTKPKRKRDAERFTDKRNTLSSPESASTFAELFEINDFKAQAEAKDTVILKLKEKLRSLNGDVNERNVKREEEEIETLNIELDHKRSDEQRNLYKALVEAYEADKIILNTYEQTVTLKRRHDDESDKDEGPSAGLDRGFKRRR
nr:hypothetical protein [Tanacetum cinerariifolium]